MTIGEGRRTPLRALLTGLPARRTRALREADRRLDPSRFRVVAAVSDEERAAVFRLRFHIYLERMGVLGPDDPLVHGAEMRDGFDRCTTNEVTGPRQDLVDGLTRAWVRSAPGRLVAMTYDPAAGALTVSGAAAKKRSQLVAYWPERLDGEPRVDVTGLERVKIRPAWGRTLRDGQGSRRRLDHHDPTCSGRTMTSDCRMRVLPARAAAHLRLGQPEYWFCSQDCLRTFVSKQHSGD